MISLRRCKNNPNHWYSGHISECPWCHRARETGHDLFPPPDNYHPVSQKLSSPASPEIGRPQPGTEGVNLHVEPPDLAVKKTGKLWAGIVGGILISLALVLYLVLFLPGSGGDIPHGSTTVQPIIPVSPVKTAIITASPTSPSVTSVVKPDSAENGFKTYTDNNYKFEIDYPATWTTSRSGAIVSFSPSSYRQPLFTVNTGRKSGELNEYFNSRVAALTRDNPKVQLTNHDYIFANGYRADFVTTDQTTRTKTMEVYLNGHSSSQVFILSFNGGEDGYNDYLDDAQDMVKSFHLI
jgi:hypothetical protein